jgi:type IV pilus assembly protein PilW
MLGRCAADWENSRGLGLMELLVAMVIGFVLITGLVQIAAAARSSFRLQEALAEMQENGRFGLDSLSGILRQSAYDPQPWLETAQSAIFTASTSDMTSAHGDRLAIRTRSDRNCFDNFNPSLDSAGLPRYYLRESILELNAAENLTHTCRYGPEEDQLVTQMNRLGLVLNVEAFQAEYAEDSDHDGEADRWVKGGGWADESRIQGLRIALLLKSSEAVVEPRSGKVEVLGESIATPADGKLRRVFTYSQAFLGRNE